MTIKHIRDVVVDDSNKIVLTAAESRVIEILFVHCIYVSTATVGTRQINLKIQDDTDVIVADVSVGATQAASLTYHYEFHRGISRETSLVNNSLQTAIPWGFCLLPGWDLIIRDVDAVDAAADDMTVNVVYKEYHLNDIEGIS